MLTTALLVLSHCTALTLQAPQPPTPPAAAAAKAAPATPKTPASPAPVQQKTAPKAAKTAPAAPKAAQTPPAAATAGPKATQTAPTAVAPEPAATTPKATSSDTEAGWGQAEPTKVVPMTPAMKWWGPGYAKITREFNMLYARTVRPHEWMFMVQHRTFVPVRISPWYNYIGFDGGSLKVGLGLRYGIIKGLDVGLLRLNGTAEPFDVYEFDARWQLLNQEKYGLDLAVRGGLTWFSEPNHQTGGGYGQLLLDRLFFDHLLVGIDVMYHSRSTNRYKTAQDPDASLAVGLSAEYRFTHLFAWGFEISQTVVGYHATNPRTGGTFPAITTGPKLITNRHTFSIVVTNTQYISSDGIVTDSYRPFDNLIVGFNITRELGGS